MKKIKSLGDIANLYDLKSIPRTRKSAKPQLATTAVLELCMARNERDRLAKEKMRISKRNGQIDKRLNEINIEMDTLAKNAQKKLAEIRGEMNMPASENRQTGIAGAAAKRESQTRTMTLDY
ncbi:MAG: hypothetical protein V1698_03385 [bacterium]